MKNELVAEISKSQVKVVSFDIFDTLLLRPAVSPTSIFRIVGRRSGFGESFIQWRVEAEQLARQRRYPEYDDITLDEIYDVFQELFSISDSEKGEIIRHEQDVESQYLYPREYTKIAFEAARDMGKKIIIISDMYLSDTFLRKVLCKNGYEGFSQLYVSSVTRRSKGSGRLYDLVINDQEKEGIEPRNILHIGDNKRADIDMAQVKGISTFYLPKVMDLFPQYRFGKILNQWQYTSIEDTDLLVGFIANKIFDNPFAQINKNAHFNGDLHMLSFASIGPLVLMMVLWMIRESKKKGIEVLTFIMRDGYLPSHALELLKPYVQYSFKTQSIYLTRALRILYNTKSRADFLAQLMDFPPPGNMNFRIFLSSRLGFDNIEEANNLSISLKAQGAINEKEEIVDLTFFLITLFKIAPNIFEYSYRKNSIFTDYLLKNIDFNKKNAVWDIGYRGSASRFFKNNFDNEVTCFQLASYPYEEISRAEGNDIYSYLSLDYEDRRNTIIIHLFEDIFSSVENSVIGITKTQDGDFSFRRECIGLPDGAKSIITYIQSCALEFVRSFCGLTKNDINEMRFIPRNFIKLLLSFGYNPTPMDRNMLKGMSFVDSAFLTGEALFNNPYASFVEPTPASPPAGNQQEVSETKNLSIYSPSQITNYLKSKARPFLSKYTTARLINFFRLAYKCHPSKPLDATKKTIMLFGAFLDFDKGVCNYLNELQHYADKYNFLVVTETSNPANDAIANGRVDLPVLTPPHLIRKTFPISFAGELPWLARRTINNSPLLTNYAAAYNDQYHSTAAKSGQFYAYLFYQYARFLIKRYKPVTIMLWNKFYIFHAILKDVAEKAGIPVIFMEFGPLPGSFTFDTEGQMGESFPAQKCASFNGLPIDDSDRSVMTAHLEFLYKTGLNRNPQPKISPFSIIKPRIKRERPIIFYAGQNDFESGLAPYTTHTREFHSPAFTSSLDALYFLDKLSSKRKWNLIYKPHPLILRSKAQQIDDGLLENTIIVDDCNLEELIDASDLVITIVSQVSYVSLIRKKPTLLLGYTHLRGSGATYEAFTKDAVEKTIEESLEYGFTGEQERAFLNHATRLSKYYLYNDLTMSSFPYRKTIADLADTLDKAQSRKHPR